MRSQVTNNTTDTLDTGPAWFIIIIIIIYSGGQLIKQHQMPNPTKAVASCEPAGGREHLTLRAVRGLAC